MPVFLLKAELQQYFQHWPQEREKKPKQNKTIILALKISPKNWISHLHDFRKKYK